MAWPRRVVTRFIVGVIFSWLPTVFFSANSSEPAQNAELVSHIRTLIAVDAVRPSNMDSIFHTHFNVTGKKEYESYDNVQRKSVEGFYLSYKSKPALSYGSVAVDLFINNKGEIIHKLSSQVIIINLSNDICLTKRSLSVDFPGRSTYGLPFVTEDTAETFVGISPNITSLLTQLRPKSVCIDKIFVRKE